jgi:DNA-binding MarR family transcriptional regulator
MYYDKAADRFMQAMSNSRSKGPMHHVGSLSKGEMFALNLLNAKCQSMSAGELRESMSISSARIAAVLGKLEAKGYVERHMDAGDRRKIEVVLTDSGRTKIVSFCESMKAQLACAFKKMGRNDTEEFLRLMVKFSEIMAEAVCNEDI